MRMIGLNSIIWQFAYSAKDLVLDADDYALSYAILRGLPTIGTEFSIVDDS